MIKELFDNRNHVILVVDDSRMMRMAFRDFLEREGYQVLEAKDGLEAIAVFTKEQPDMVLMDYIMPGMDGVTACQELQRCSGGGVPVIMITSLDDENSANAAFAAGVADYISKPINWAVLRQRLKRLLAARDSELSLDQSEAFARSIIQHATIGIITLGSDGMIKFVNPAAETIFGYTVSELVNCSISSLIPALSDETCWQAERAEYNFDEKTELSGCRQDGSTFALECTINPFTVLNQCFITLMLRDVTERKQYEEIIRHQAFYDSLTDLPNRLLLKERIMLEIARAERNKKKLAVLYLDLDRFKLINDTLGHDSGDQVLQEIGHRLRDTLRGTDTVARLGGDEFAMLLPDLVSEEYLGRVCTHLLDDIKKPMIISGYEIFLTASIGVAIYPDDGKEYDTLLANADVAMYQAKEKGKNNFQLYTAALNAKALERLALENSLRRAVDYKEFVVHYQPKVNGRDRRVIGMEALVRWQHPQWGLVPPDKFIPMAEETGLIVPIGEWVLRTACQQNKNLQNAGLPPLTVAVNLSARQFELQDLATIVARILQETGLEPQYLELEITESIAMHNLPHTLKTINDLKEIGVQFSIDDFGTGYSSLSKLNSISVNKLKIDKSFVHRIDGNKDNSVIASTILALGKSLELGVVAEGVESEEQAQFFCAGGCDEMQGYFFGKPMTQERFAEFYRQKLMQDQEG